MPTNYQNWLAAGDVYAAVVPFNYDTAYEQAMANYVKAQQLNPLNPGDTSGYGSTGNCSQRF
jgi:hypothetical protein